MPRPDPSTTDAGLPVALPPGGTPVAGRLGPRLWRLLGLGLTGLGTLGLAVPLLPTTIFWILAAYCFGRGDPELQARLFAHPRFGPPIAAFVTRGVLGRRAKGFALAGLAAAATLGWLALAPSPARLVYLGIIGLVAVYIVTRPKP